MSYCAVIGPMPEQYKPEHIQKNTVVGFFQEENGKTGGREPSALCHGGGEIQ